jgi:alpha-tubulin suppressor-like RCC1 family protein
VLRPLTFAMQTLRVVGGGFHSLMLHADGMVVADGWNVFGQLGDGTVTARIWPQPVQGLSNVASVSAGGLHSLALTRDHRLLAWGGNRFGQLGAGSTNDGFLPMEIGVPAVATVSAGGLHSAVTTG